MTEMLPEHVDRFLAEVRLENEHLRKRVEARKKELYPGAREAQWIYHKQGNAKHV